MLFQYLHVFLHAISFYQSNNFLISRYLDISPDMHETFFPDIIFNIFFKPFRWYNCIHLLFFLFIFSNNSLKERFGILPSRILFISLQDCIIDSEIVHGLVCSIVILPIPPFPEILIRHYFQTYYIIFHYFCIDDILKRNMLKYTF